MKLKRKQYTPEFNHQIIKESLDTGNAAIVAHR